MAYTLINAPPPLARYLAHVREVEGPHVGSGYVAGYGCHRALQEAFSGLFFTAAEQRNDSQSSYVSSDVV